MNALEYEMSTYNFSLMIELFKFFGELVEQFVSFKKLIMYNGVLCN